MDERQGGMDRQELLRMVRTLGRDSMTAMDFAGRDLSDAVGLLVKVRQ